MEPLTSYTIPDDILLAHNDNDHFVLDQLQKMVNAARKDEESYIKLTKAMIYLEEAANSEEARTFDFNVPTEKMKVVSNRLCQIKMGVPVKVSSQFLFM